MREYFTFDYIIWTILCIPIVDIVLGNYENPEVITKIGTIRGVRATNGNYSKFLGIPFARVNETNPFGESLTYPNFDDVFEAYNDDFLCPQREGYNHTIVGSLDCLNLNIYVPDSASVENPLPVMIYIFGGTFVLGGPDDFSLGPKFFMEHDVVLVKINYRLGPYGFMCLHTPEVPGNQGLRDQIRAMRWVKEHIGAFGGNPDLITLFGNSAGSVSVDYHLLSEEETLYNNVILQSGTAFLDPLIGANPGALLDLAESLGLVTTDFNKAIEHLKAFDPHTVIKASIGLDKSAFYPCIETKIEGVKRIISDNYVNLSAPKAKDVKIMIGSNDDEALYYFFYYVKPALIPFMTGFFKRKLGEYFFLENENLEVAEKMVRNFYMGDENFTAEVLFEMSDFYSDLAFIHGTERTFRKYLQSGAEEIYYYIFSYNGERNFMQIQTNSDARGAYHADELGYLFDVGVIKEEPTPEDRIMINRMTTMWTNFATYGKPIPEPSELLPVTWEPITQGSVYHYVNITTNMSTGRKPFHQRMAFWDLFYEAFGQYERARFRVPGSSAPGLSAYNYLFVTAVCLFQILLKL